MDSVKIANLLNQLNLAMGSPFKYFATGWPIELMAAGRENNYPSRKLYPMLICAPLTGTDDSDDFNVQTTYRVDLLAAKLQDRDNDNQQQITTITQQCSELHALLKKYFAALQVYCANNGLAELTAPTFEYDSNTGEGRLVTVRYSFTLTPLNECVYDSVIQDAFTALNDAGYNTAEGIPTTDLEQLTGTQIIDR